MWLYKLNQRVAPILASYWRLTLQGEVDAVPMEGPLILAPNHASFLDPCFVGLVFPRRIRYLMTASWYHRSPSWRAFFHALGALPVAENRDAEGTFSTLLTLLDKGEVVGIFPEGRISADGALGRFRLGVTLLAARSGAPVLPIGIRGNFEAFSRHHRVPRPRKVSVHVGGSLQFQGGPVDGMPERSAMRSFNMKLLQEVSRLTQD